MNMKIHGICIAKNEADIIAQTLTKASEWCDYIYVVDNASDDNTWGKILEISKKYSQIIPHKQDNRQPFDDYMRGEVFHDFSSNNKPGDWWCRLDADEFYIDDPRTFLNKVPNQYQAVWSASFQYYFTDKDLERYNQDPSSFSDNVPVEEKCRYYLNNWSENRFFRYDQKIVWDKNCGWPYFGAIYPKRIRLKHYQYRSPQQIQQRIVTRFEARSKGSSSFPHEAQVTQSINPAESIFTSSAYLDDLDSISSEIWKKRIVPASKLYYDEHNNEYVMRKDLMPPLPEAYIPFLANKFRYLRKYSESKYAKLFLHSKKSN